MKVKFFTAHALPMAVGVLGDRFILQKDTNMWRSLAAQWEVNSEYLQRIC